MNTVTISLVVFTVVSGILWFIEKYQNIIKRRIAKQENNLSAYNEAKKDSEEGFLSSIASCFPILLVVFLIRSFSYEPFRIPSASMMPTLLRGDFILVDKFEYGIRNPFNNEIWIKNNEIKRGDVVVFKYPENPKVDYIKRIVGLPGDRILQRQGRIYIQPKNSSTLEYIDEMSVVNVEQKYKELNAEYPSEHGIILQEDLLGKKHQIMHDYNSFPNESFYQQESLDYGEWVVPENKYFAMGDNREHSRDSRYWGFVSDEHIVGKAVVIWMSFTTDKGLMLDRIGQKISE